MKTITDKIKESFSAFSIKPNDELLAYAEACDAYSTETIDSAEMQNALCSYMDSCASRSRALSAAVGRTKEPPMADVFTEATNMLVDAIVRGKDPNVKVFSEKNVKLKCGYRKPDVSIWKNDKLIGVVECKTCLGRRRDDWQKDYEKRVSELSELQLTESQVILFVETEQTWQGFPTTDARTLKTWFTLCPKGSWHGGGKTGEVKLREKQNEGIVDKFKTRVLEIIS